MTKVRCFVMLSVIAGCFGCAPRGEAPSQATAQTADTAPTHKALQPALAPDPLTIAAGTLSIASSLTSLFGGQDSDPKSLKKKLDALRAQNEVTHDMLRQVLAILKDLGVTVRDAVKEENIVLMQAQLQSEITQFYETYNAELEDRRARDDAKRRYATEIIGDVQNLSTTLMHPDFGFSAANTVGHGMILDLWMARRIGWRSTLIGNRAKTYREYFERSLDEKVVDSPAAKLAEARARRERLQAVLTEADRIVGASGWSKQIRRFSDNRTVGNCWETFTVTITETVTGDQVKGYMPSTNRGESELRRECERPGGPGCVVCKRLNALPLGAEKAAADPVRPQSETPVVMAQYWNAVLASRKSVDADIEVLTKINDALKEYLGFAQRVERRP